MSIDEAREALDRQWNTHIGGLFGRASDITAAIEALIDAKLSPAPAGAAAAETLRLQAHAADLMGIGSSMVRLDKDNEAIREAAGALRGAAKTIADLEARLAEAGTTIENLNV